MSREVALCRTLRPSGHVRATRVERAGQAPRSRKVVADPALAAIVEDGLAKRWSPAKTAARLRWVITPTAGAARVARDDLHLALPPRPLWTLMRVDRRAALRPGMRRRRRRGGGQAPTGPKVWATLRPCRPPEAAVACRPFARRSNHGRVQPLAARRRRRARTTDRATPARQLLPEDVAGRTRPSTVGGVDVCPGASLAAADFVGPSHTLPNQDEKWRSLTATRGQPKARSAS